MKTKKNNKITGNIKGRKKPVGSNLLFTSKLNKKCIGVSISNSENIYELGFSDMHRDDALIEISRYLLVQGSILAYGGDLRKGGYTMMLSDLAYQYRAKEEQNRFHVVNYSSYPIYKRITQGQRNEFVKNRVNFKPIHPPSPIRERKYFEPLGNENKFIWAVSLHKMREEMNKECNARILIGGKLSGYFGRIPGIVEESILSLASNKPTYLIGAFGGASEAVIKCLTNKKCKELTQSWQFKDFDYREFVRFYNSQNKSNKINYKAILSFLNNYTLNRLSKNNGLTIEENKRLFETIHIPEMVFLILKGLNKKLSK